MSGIQLHPHDVLDEGMPQVVAYLRQLRDVRYVFLEVNTIFERNPEPVGVLPHNPVRDVVVGTGTLHADLPAYLGAGLDQRREPDPAGRDPLRLVADGVPGGEFEVVPWLNLLNGHFEGDRLADNSVVEVSGRPVAHWLCPNGPDVVDFWAQVFVDLRERYGYTRYLIDRIRYPDWSGSATDPRQLLTCFCPHCRAGMTERGLDVPGVEEAIGTWVELLGEHRYDDAVDHATTSAAVGAWIAFRQQSVTGFVTRLVERLGSVDEAFTLWLDLWPPAYGWLLGQDYAALTAVSPVLKHFPYHKLGGGADVQGLVEHLADTPERREAAFGAFKRFFDLPYDLSYATFKADGFPIEFVADQNDKVRATSAPGTHIFSGIQMWNLGADNLVEAIRAAERSAADELLYYCYGWASDDLFEAVRALRDGDDARRGKDAR